jgi:hypothetical protein
MCVDPLTAVSIGGGVLGAAGSLFGGSANAQAAELQAKVAQANSQMALDYGEGKVAQISQRVSNTIGASRASYAAGNLALNSGSPLAVQAMSAQQGNTDKQLALAGALNQAAGQSFTASAAYSRADQDRLAGVFGAGTSLLHGIGGVRGFGSNAFGGAGGWSIGNDFNQGIY